MEKRESYPLIFVHGMFGWGQNEGIDKLIPYWGATTGSLIDYLREKGNECYAASVGPMSSAWDQACELYAQLTGTTVDYGIAHSEAYGHARFGRVYEEPLFEGWSEERKVHLIGHSFGGNAIRMLTHLLTHGAQDEQEVTEESDLSPLFKGGNEGLINSVNTICSPMSGTKAYFSLKKIKLIRPMIWAAYTYAGVLGRSRLNGKWVDFHLEHFGLTDGPESEAEPFAKTMGEITQKDDNIAFDMMPEGSKIMNDRIETSPNIYYFSYPYNAVIEYKNGEERKPLNIDFFFLKMTSKRMLKDAESIDADNPEYANDGLVNVSSQSYPNDEPFKYFEGKAEKGLWNVMPTREGDHGTAIGLFADKDRTHRFYDELVETIRTTEG